MFTSIPVKLAGICFSKKYNTIAPTSVLVVDKRKIDKLSVLSAAKVNVIRNGIQYEVLSEDLVLDDITVLTNGKKISADSIVKEGQVEVNESLLTGEALPVKKKVGDILFAGSFVSSGSCYAKVERVGKDIYVYEL